MKGLLLLTLLSIAGYASGASGHLSWQREVNAKRSFGDPEVVSTAQFYCANLTLDDHSDWRLPTVSELSLVAGPGTEPEGFYWSTTVSKTAHHTALAVDSHTGSIHQEPESSYHWVRCVR